MRVPGVDQPLSDEEWRSFLAEQAFGHLVAAGVGRPYPVVAPLPFSLDGDLVSCHAPVGAEVLDAISERPECLLAVSGAVAFVPSAWKAIGEEDPLLGIPTSYFAEVQLAGRAEVVAEPAALSALLRRQLAAFQPEVPVADPEVAHAARLRAIRGIELRVEQVEARFKFGGNVDEAHRVAVLERLVQRDRDSDAAAVGHLRRRVST